MSQLFPHDYSVPPTNKISSTAERFPYDANRHLTPPPATVKEYNEFKHRLGITHSVLTHGLSYGADCSCLTDFTSDLGQDATKGIAVIDPSTVTSTQLKEMHINGIRGIRVNMYRYGAMHDVERQKEALRAHARALDTHCLGWSMAFTHTHPEFWAELEPVIAREVVPRGIQLVTDHFALLKGQSMLPAGCKDIMQQTGLQEVLELVRAGYLYVKISAPYRVSTLAPGYEDLRPLVRALLEANPQQVLWGSDWPHTPLMKVRTREEALQVTPYLEVDDRAWLESLQSWLTDQEWHMLMVLNPRRLYDQ
ncbi:hypothetical protein N7462_002040 [Penicillium macrosclerotiorum]|uniref:uncharacterized protein n=1 Tax=Penicillium macrosclerotiorum TaxID=303699 RepID=UPI0025485235|nr:uncharacterized protein N7462_002040 [Penicillium macrosclerotiorum]KAJ5692617.1 hypothetical protein N7462_002040 [Penicillium macrosclerotiorum]